MRRTYLRFLGSAMTAAMLTGTLGQFPVYAAVENGWEEADGKHYWYENGVRQGTEGRGKEIYDPGSDAWYWLDAVDDGKMAVSKDVYQESQADDAGNMGKWVRYDGEGHMVKGWDDTEAGTYYFDLTYGTMAKGSREIDGVPYFFNEKTGILESGARGGWAAIDGRDYWYENGVRQGYDPNNPNYRGKEIYDPGSDAWYWLDNVQQGAKAVSKDVYQESQAGPWAENSDGTGKWVRYDSDGHMVKGWETNGNGTYYFDLTYGTMAKGKVEIEGKEYHFDQVTGILVKEAAPTDTPGAAFRHELISFGSYPQTEVSSPSSDITGASYDRNGDAVVGGQRYRRVEDIEYGYKLEKASNDDNGPPVYDMIPYVEQDNGYRYFKYEPIQWEKIQLDGEEYLLAKDALDAQPYDRQQRQQIYTLGVYMDTAKHSNWEECSLRPWLNDDFISTAFTEEEQSGLQTTPSGDRVSLLSSDEVKELSRLADPPKLNKTASDYAALKGSNDKGLQLNKGSFFEGGCEWILRDILTMYDSKGEPTEFLSPRHVKVSGELCSGQEILIPYDSAIVPLIKASDVGTPSYPETDETVIVYRPWGEAKRISKNEFDTYMKNGWFQSPGAARNFIADHINNKFKASEAYASYSGCVKSWATTAYPEITIVYNQKEDPSFQEIASFVDGLIDGTLTGKMEDYMRFDIELPGNHLYEDEQEALQAMYTAWGRVVNSSRASYFRIDVNGVGSFNYDDTDYFNKIHEIANQAKQYSPDQERQLGYIKTWLAQNAYYDGNQFGNDPITLILHGKGVCGNYANAVKDICVLLDIPCMVISNKDANHARNCLYVHNNWYELDFTGVEQPYTDGDLILFPLSYGTHSGDVISPEWFDYMKELYKDNTAASVGPTQQIENTIYGAPAIKVNLNGQDVSFAHPPVLNAGRVYAVYEDIAQAYGASVTKDGDWVTMSKNGVNVMFSLNTAAGSVYYVRSSDFKRELTFSDRPYWADGSFYVPLADIIKGFNMSAEVEWNPDEGYVSIKD